MKNAHCLAHVVVRHRFAFALCWLLLCAGLLPLAGRAAESLDVSARIEGSESAAVEAALAQRFESPFATTALLVVKGLPPPDTKDGQEALREVVSRLGQVPSVGRTFSYLDTRDRLFLTPSGTFVIVGLATGVAPLDAQVAALRASTEPVAASLRRRFPGTTLRLTGEPVLNFDLRRASTSEVRLAERRALPLTLPLLLLAFGVSSAAILPLVAGGLAIVVAMSAAFLLTRVTPLSVTLESVVSMLSLGLGIDYALLMVSRFRESYGAGRSAEAAAEEAARHAGGTVVLSGAAVAVGFLGLLAVPLREIRSIAVGGLIVVAAAVLLATTLLPGLLAWLGPRIARRASDTCGTPARGRWRAWGAWVAAHPVRVLVLAGTPVVGLAFQARALSTELPNGDWLPPSMESTVALHELQAMGRSGLVQEIRVLLEFPEDVSSVGAVGWAATRRVGERLAADPRVAEVRSLRTFAGERADDLAYISLLPGFLKHSYLSGEADAALLEVIPREQVAASELCRMVRELRGANAAAWAGVPGARLRIGGVPAFNADYEDLVAGRFPITVLLVVSGTLLALALAFRSVLVPIKAVALNLLSVAASFGAVVLVFQQGWGGSVLGLAGATGSVFPAVPVLVFSIVFGLSMDYEVFLVARVAEARRAGLSDAEGLAEGLAGTGAVITSAAAVMVAVFGAFAAGELLLVKMLGFALAVAVLLDASVIRIAVGPALLRLAGRFNWWPGGRAAGPSPARSAEPLTGPRAGANMISSSGAG